MWDDKISLTWKSLSHVQLSATAWTVHGILQARILEWVAIRFSRGSSQPRVQTQVSCIAGRLFTVWATRKSLFIYIYLFMLFFEIHFRKLVHVTVGTGKSEICRASWQMGNSGRSWCCADAAALRKNFFFCRKSVFALKAVSQLWDEAQSPYWG